MILATLLIGSLTQLHGHNLLITFIHSLSLNLFFFLPWGVLKCSLCFSKQRLVAFHSVRLHSSRFRSQFVCLQTFSDISLARSLSLHPFLTLCTFTIWPVPVSFVSLFDVIWRSFCVKFWCFISPPLPYLILIFIFAKFFVFVFYVEFP